MEFMEKKKKGKGMEKKKEIFFIKFSERRTKFKDFDTKKDGIGRGILSENNCCTLVEIRI